MLLGDSLRALSFLIGSCVICDLHVVRMNNAKCGYALSTENKTTCSELGVGLCLVKD